MFSRADGPAATQLQNDPTPTAGTMLIPATPPPPGSACGQPLESTAAMLGTAWPEITPALAKLAEPYPELQPGYDADYVCTNADSDCQAHASGAISADQETAIRENQLTNQADMSRLTGVITDQALADTGDSVAAVSQNGFARTILDYKHIYTYHEHQKFHQDAAGIDASHAAAVEAERARQARLAEIFTAMQSELEKTPRDTSSPPILSFYREEAQKNEKNLGLISCELNAMAEKDRAYEKNLRALSHAAKEPSGVSGAAPEGALAPKGGTLSTAEAPAKGRALAAAQEEILSPVGAYFSAPAAAAGAEASADTGADAEADLFLRVHRKYRAKDAAGAFRAGLLDGLPAPALP